MNFENVLCNYCGNRAQCFSLFQTQKLAACSTHIQTLVEKGFNSYPVEAYYFIDSPEDVPVYAERHLKITIGLSNLSIWESQLVSQHQECLHSIEVTANLAAEFVKRSFLEFKLRIDQIYAQTQAMLNESKTALLEFRQKKEKQIDANTDLLCQETKMKPNFFRMIIADLKLPLVDTIRKHTLIAVDHFDEVVACIDQTKRESQIQVLLRDANHLVKEGQIEFAAEMLEYAKSLGAETDTDFMRNMLESHRRHIDQKIIGLFPLSKSEEEVKKAAEAYFQEGVTYTSAFAENLTNLETAWRLLEETKTANKQTSKVGAALGELLCFHFSRHEEALRVVRRSLEIEVSLDPLSDSAMNLRNLISAIYDFEGNYESSEEVCRTTLQLFSDSSNSSDSYWTTLFFLCRAYIDQLRNSEVESIIEQCLSLHSGTSTKLSEILKNMLKSWLLAKNRDILGAQIARSAAYKAASKEFPSSIFAALNLFDWATMHVDDNKEKRKAMHLEAHKMLSIHYPLSHYTRSNLFWMERLIDPKSLEIVRIRDSFCAQLKEKHPLSIETAFNYLCLANSCFDAKKYDEAITARSTANEILSKHYQSHMATAVNLTCLGDLSLLIRDTNRARTYYSDSKQLHELHHAGCCESAFNLYRLAVLESVDERKDDAIRDVSAALSIWTANGSSMRNSHAAALISYLNSKMSAVLSFSSLN